jgi:hypothetical protein
MERAAPQDILRFEAVGIEPPFDNKERPSDPSDFTQGDGQDVLAWIPRHAHATEGRGTLR